MRKYTTCKPIILIIFVAFAGFSALTTRVKACEDGNSQPFSLSDNQPPETPLQPADNQPSTQPPPATPPGNNPPGDNALEQILDNQLAKDNQSPVPDDRLDGATRAAETGFDSDRSTISTPMALPDSAAQATQGLISGMASNRSTMNGGGDSSTPVNAMPRYRGTSATNR